jgi:hypothetical protein
LTGNRRAARSKVTRAEPLGGYVALTSQGLRVVSYRFRVTFRRRWAGYLSLALLIGLVGGVAMGALAAARRTQSSYSAFLASTNPSNLSLGTGLYNPKLGFDTGYNPRLVGRIAHLKNVKHAESYANFYAVPLGPNGQPTAASENASYNVLGSLDGLFFNQDRVTVVQGRMANPAKPDEFVMTVAAARKLGLRVGQTTRWGTYTTAQASSLSGQPPRPALETSLTLVGTVVLNNAVVQDDIDASNATTIILTPALSGRLVACCSEFSFTYLQLEHGSRDVASVETEVERVMPAVLPYDFDNASIGVTKAEHAIKPEAIALAAFGGIAALAAIVIASQLIGRQLRTWSGERRTMRALGADPVMIAGDGLVGIMGAVAVGALVALLMAVALSPLSPLGPVRPYYPDPGIAFDWTVLGLGVLILVGVLGAVAVALAASGALRRAGVRSRRPRRESRMIGAAASAGMPVPVVTGLRFALDPPSHQSDPVPVRSAVLGAALAVAVVIGTVVFGTSLRALVSQPPLYGWNWGYELSSSGGAGPVPADRAAAVLRRDPQVAAWSGYYFANLQVDGQTIPVLGATPHEPVAPPILAGHGFNGPGQIVLGPGTLAELHLAIGNTVTVGYGATRPERLRIVGTATMPVVGIGGLSSHVSMGTGAIVSYQLIPPTVRNQFDLSPPGPNAIFVRLRTGTDAAAARRPLERIAAALSLPTNYGVTLLAAQRPAEIVNYRSMGTTPAILGLALAAGAVAALALTLVASVRRRRRDLALLKTLGFTKRQLAATVSCQSSVAVGIGILVGVPLGIALGRVLWDQFAEQIYAVPRPSVPILPLVVISVVALALANLVAAWPGRIAARTRPALLRAE